MKQAHVYEYEAHKKLKTEFSTLNEENFILENDNSALQSKSSKLEDSFKVRILWILKMS